MRPRFGGLWRHREFLKFWAASGISDVGTQITALAVPLIAALTLGATPWQMGLLSAAGSAPVIFIGLFAGVWVDRLRKRPVMIAGDLGRAALLLTVPVASVMGVLRIELLYVVLLLSGSLTVLFDIAFMSFVPSLVDRQQLLEGNSKLESTSATAQVVGPSVGGTLVTLLSAPGAVLVDAISFLASALLLIRTRVIEPASARRDERGGVRKEIGEGLRVVAHDRILRSLAGCSATTMLFGHMFLSVYVLYMTRDLGLSAFGIGLVFATGGLGGLTGSIVAAPVARRFGLGPALIGAQLGFGLTGMLVPLAVLVPKWSLPMIVASEFAQWMTLLVYYVNAISVRQVTAPERLLGRVNATMRFLAGGAHPIGALIGGALGGLIGLPLTLVVAEFGLLLAVLWLVRAPVRRLGTIATIARRELAPTGG